MKTERRVERETKEEFIDRIARFTPKDIESIVSSYDHFNDGKVRAFARAFKLVPHAEVTRIKTRLTISGNFNPMWGISKPLNEALYAVFAGDLISDDDYLILTESVIRYD